MDYESTLYECDLWQGTLVLTCKETGDMRQVTLKTNNRLSTQREFESCIKTHGIDRTCETFWKLGV